jgi:hypothetical protein
VRKIINHNWIIEKKRIFFKRFYRFHCECGSNCAWQPELRQAQYFGDFHTEMVTIQGRLGKL